MGVATSSAMCESAITRTARRRGSGGRARGHQVRGRKTSARRTRRRKGSRVSRSPSSSESLVRSGGGVRDSARKCGEERAVVESLGDGERSSPEVRRGRRSAAEGPTLSSSENNLSSCSVEDSGPHEEKSHAGRRSREAAFAARSLQIRDVGCQGVG